VIGMYGSPRRPITPLCRSLARMGADGVRVNCIAPGLIETDFARAAVRDPETGQARGRDAVAPARPARGHRRLGLLLASPAGAFITGTISRRWRPDGGVAVRVTRLMAVDVTV